MAKKDYKTGIHKIFLIAFFVIICGLLFLSQNWFGNVKARSINVEGNSFLSKKEILSMIAEDTIKKFGEIDSKVLEEKIEANPYILNATCTKDAIGNLDILVKERNPFAMIYSSEENKLLFCSEDGTVFLHRQFLKSVDVPLINFKNEKLKIVNNKITNSKKITEALQFLKLANEENKTLYYDISEITDDKRGNMLIFTNQKAIPVLIGKNNFEQKTKILNTFLIQFPIEFDSSKTKYIDARFDEQIILGTNFLATN